MSLPLIYRAPLPPEERPRLTAALRRALHVHLDALASANTRTAQRAALEAIRSLCSAALVEDAPQPERANEGLMPRAEEP